MPEKPTALQLVQDVVQDEVIAKRVIDQLRTHGHLKTAEAASYGNSDVNLIIRTFSELYGATKATQWDRYAAHRLAKAASDGATGVVGLMQAYASVATDRYAPVVGSVAEFESKLPKIINYLRKRGTESDEIQL